MYVRVNQLMEGMVVERDVEADHHVIISKGTRLTGLLIAAIQAYNVDGVFIDDEVSPKLVLPASYASEEIGFYLNKLHYHDIKALHIAGYIADFYYTSKYLKELRQYDNYTYEHSVGVLVLSVILGMHLCLSHEELADLALASLAHDIGKMNVPLHVLGKSSPLTDDEVALIRKHPLFSKKIMECYGANKRVCEAVLQHHENYNGSGYPNGLREDEIDMLASIVHVADVFDAYVGTRVYHQARTNIEGYTFVLEKCGVLFHPKVVEAFKDVIVPYPVDSTISTIYGPATVIANHRTDPLHPIVRVEDGTLIDLKTK